MSGHQFPHISGQDSSSVHAGDRYTSITISGNLGKSSRYADGKRRANKSLVLLNQNPSQAETPTEQLQKVALQLETYDKRLELLETSLALQRMQIETRTRPEDISKSATTISLSDRIKNYVPKEEKLEVHRFSASQFSSSPSLRTAGLPSQSAAGGSNRNLAPTLLAGLYPAGLPSLNIQKAPTLTTSESSSQISAGLPSLVNTPLLLPKPSFIDALHTPTETLQLGNIAGAQAAPSFEDILERLHGLRKDGTQLDKLLHGIDRPERESTPLSTSSLSSSVATPISTPGPAKAGPQSISTKTTSSTYAARRGARSRGRNPRAAGSQRPKPPLSPPPPNSISATAVTVSAAVVTTASSSPSLQPEKPKDLIVRPVTPQIVDYLKIKEMILTYKIDTKLGKTQLDITSSYQHLIEGINVGTTTHWGVDAVAKQYLLTGDTGSYTIKLFLVKGWVWLDDDSRIPMIDTGHERHCSSQALLFTSGEYLEEQRTKQFKKCSRSCCASLTREVAKLVGYGALYGAARLLT